MAGIELTKTDRERIRLNRLAGRQSQEKVAALVGKSHRWIGRIESGRGYANMKFSDLERMADALHVGIDDLVGP